MSDPLTQFRAEALGQCFTWNGWDCGLLCAAWVERMRGVDPATRWRGRYRSALGCARLVKREGGLVAVFDKSLKPLGIERTEAPQRGDIVVVKTAQGDTGAVVLGTLIMMAAARGIVLRQRSAVPIQAAWRI